MRRLNLVNRKNTLKVVKELDAFPKIPESYKETTATGGGVSILTFVIIIILVISEMFYYSESELEFDYLVDPNVDGKLKINVDITVAMKCHAIGADCLDMTGQDVQAFGQLQQDDAYFDLTPAQQQYQNMLQEFNQYLREDYHAIQEVLWLTTGVASLAASMPDSNYQRSGPPDACRVHGSLTVNRVAGNFHITAGKSIPVIPRGHAHLALLVPTSEYNFSHRIDHFSFGDLGSKFVHPLDGEVMITKDNYHMFQYFMQVVPTEVRTYKNILDTYQFAVTEKNRTINHDKGSHGVAGIFIKYDLASLKIRVREEHKPYWQFLVRLCGIIGGMFSVSGMLHSLVSIILCRYNIADYKELKEEEKGSAQPAAPRGLPFNMANTFVPPANSSPPVPPTMDTQFPTPSMPPTMDTQYPTSSAPPAMEAQFSGTSVPPTMEAQFSGTSAPPTMEGQFSGTSAPPAMEGQFSGTSAPPTMEGQFSGPSVPATLDAQFSNQSVPQTLDAQFPTPPSQLPQQQQPASPQTLIPTLAAGPPSTATAPVSTDPDNLIDVNLLDS